MSNEALATQSMGVQGFDPFRAMDLCDDELIKEELNNRISKTWVYKFPQDGKDVIGLSKIGVDQACRHLASKGEVIREESVGYDRDPVDDRFMLFTAYASRIAVSSDGLEIVLERVSGTKRQCVYIVTRAEGITDRVNPFWFEQGSMKAFRNARFRLLSEDVKAQVITMALAAGNVKNITPADDIQSKGNGHKPMKEPGEKKAAPETDAPAVVSVIVAEVFEQEGVNKKTGKPYTKYTIKDESGIEYGTFSKSFAQFAHESIGSGIPVHITYKQTQYGNDLENIALPEEQGEQG